MSAVFPRRGGGFRSAWRELAARTWGTGSVDPELGERDAERVRDAIRACLEARGGELAARAQAASLGLHYLNLNDEGRRRFLRILTEFDLDRSAGDRAVAEMQGAQTAEEYRSAAPGGDAAASLHSSIAALQQLAARVQIPRRFARRRIAPRRGRIAAQSGQRALRAVALVVRSRLPRIARGHVGHPGVPPGKTRDLRSGPRSP